MMWFYLLDVSFSPPFLPCSCICTSLSFKNMSLKCAGFMKDIDYKICGQAPCPLPSKTKCGFHFAIQRPWTAPSYVTAGTPGQESCVVGACYLRQFWKKILILSDDHYVLQLELSDLDSSAMRCIMQVWGDMLDQRLLPVCAGTHTVHFRYASVRVNDFKHFYCGSARSLFAEKQVLPRVISIHESDLSSLNNLYSWQRLHPPTEKSSCRAPYN